MNDILYIVDVHVYVYRKIILSYYIEKNSGLKKKNN